MRVKTNILLLATALAAAAVAGCGDDSPADDDAGIDGGDDDDDVDAAPAACAEFDAPAGTISSFPGSFDGDLMGKGANISVGETVCDDERAYFAPVGEDEVVEVTGLTVDNTYVVRLVAAEDLSFYVATACDEAAGGPGGGDCLLFDDINTAGAAEVAEFRATTTSVSVVVDNWSATLLTDGTYTLTVEEAECVTSDDCDAGAPVCLDFACVECASPFDCDSGGASACDLDSNTCVVGFDTCTGDDDNEPDDGPLTATELTAPTLVTPTTATGAICSAPLSEDDWYSVVMPDDGRLQVSVAWTGAQDLDVLFFNSEGVRMSNLGDGQTTANPERFAVFDLDAGTYFLELFQFSPIDAAAAVAYTLTLSIPECQDSFDCGLVTDPICDVVTNTCVAGVNTCTTDDDVAEAGGDDGPAGATLLAVAPGGTEEADGSICSQPTSELDFFEVVVVDGEGLEASLAWTEAAVDLDLVIFDADGERVGESFWQMPETVTLTYLPAGSYFLAVQKFSAADPAPIDYTISVTRTAAQDCDSPADCASEHLTQFYRMNCTPAGACAFYDPPGNGSLGDMCDSFDDCASGICSYLVFESDAEHSTCSALCDTTADCTEALGPGFSCTTPFEQNFCTTDCDDDLQCGANINSSTLDDGLPWNFLTCTDGACAG